MKIVWKMPDGFVRVSTPSVPKPTAESENAYLLRIAARIVEAKPGLRVAQRFFIPDEAHNGMDKIFREAWAWNGELGYDLAKAKAVCKRLRPGKSALIDAASSIIDLRSLLQSS